MSSEPTSIRSKIRKIAKVRWKDAHWIQTRTTKTITDVDKQALKMSIIDNDFISPFTVWESPDDSELYILDGHHKQDALRELEDVGYNIPEELPAVFIACDSKEEAAKLVYIFSSQYSKVNPAGIKEFLDMYGLTSKDLEGVVSSDIYIEDLASPIEVDTGDDQLDIPEDDNFEGDAGGVGVPVRGQLKAGSEAREVTQEDVQSAKKSTYNAVTLYYNDNQLAEFNELFRRLKPVLGAKDLATTILESMRRVDTLNDEEDNS